ncbi:MAG: hypothetical protein IIB71_05000 [Proteobacteria bacterium]|nr:hypothetical protein [Pseudomonadota bacterium]
MKMNSRIALASMVIFVCYHSSGQSLEEIHILRDELLDATTDQDRRKALLKIRAMNPNQKVEQAVEEPAHVVPPEPIQPGSVRYNYVNGVLVSLEGNIDFDQAKRLLSEQEVSSSVAQQLRRIISLKKM